MTDPQIIQNQIARWSKRTFGEGKEREQALARHLIDEATEVLQAVQKQESPTSVPDPDHTEIKYQMADVMIILVDLAEKYGFTMEDLFIAMVIKMNINRQREWDGPDENGMYHHKLPGK